MKNYLNKKPSTNNWFNWDKIEYLVKQSIIPLIIFIICVIWFYMIKLKIDDQISCKKYITLVIVDKFQTIMDRESVLYITGIYKKDIYYTISVRPEQYGMFAINDTINMLIDTTTVQYKTLYK